MKYPVDVVVVTHNSRDVISAMLDSLPPALDGLAGRIVVVDNASTDGTPALLDERSDCVVVRAANRGYSAGINRGVEVLAGRGPILVLNPDVRLNPGCVRKLVEASQVPGTGIVAPKVLDVDGELCLSLRREPSLGRALGMSRTGRAALSEKVTDLGDYEAPRIVDWALGAVLLVTRTCHEKLGGWDESFFLYSEETDLCLRARDIGIRTRYEPRAVCTHIGGASGRSPATHAMQVVNRVRLYRRRNGLACGLLYYFLTLASEASWVIRGQSQSRTAIASLLSPRRRPAELNCSEKLLPT